MPTRRPKPTRGPRPAYDHGPPIRRIPFAPFTVLAALGPLLVALTAPVRTHALMFDFLQLPQTHDALPRRPVHRIGVTITGQATLDGAFLSDGSLSQELSAMAKGGELPGIVYEPDPLAAYGDALRVLALVKSAGLAQWQFCFGGLSNHGDFDKPWRTKAMYLSIFIDPEKSLKRPDAETLRCDPGTALPLTVE